MLLYLETLVHNAVRRKLEVVRLGQAHVPAFDLDRKLPR